MTPSKLRKDFSAKHEEITPYLQTNKILPSPPHTKQYFNIFEALGFTSSISSIVKELEQTGQIDVLSSFPQSLNSNQNLIHFKAGTLSNSDTMQSPLNHTAKRIRFLNNFLLRVLLIAIIINFVLILLL
ncbi:MAG: hypothetical protein ACTSRL_03055 [Candidatus Helarchaeota archaeon]